MSKKIEAIKKAVFYSQQKPEKLAEIIAGLITDTATSIDISGEDSIVIPSGDTANTVEYSAKVLSQYGDAMTGSVTFSLKASVTGVSISGSTISVAKTAENGSFVLVATSGAITAEKEVSIAKETA